MKFYSLYSKSQKRYNVPFLAMSDDDAIDKVSKMVSMQDDPALVMSLDDLSLCMVGGFNPVLMSPMVTFEGSAFLDPVLDNLHTDLPLPPMVKQMVDKFYAGGTQNAE